MRFLFHRPADTALPVGFFQKGGFSVQLRTPARRKEWWIALGLIAPAVLLRAFSTLYPIVQTFINSFFNLSYLSAQKGKFIGFDNYTKMFRDIFVVDSFEFTLLFTIISMLFHVVLGVLLAVMLNVHYKGQRFLRTITLIPWAMPVVVAAQAGRFMFNDQFGLINDLIRRVVPSFSHDWLVKASSARAAVIAVDVWKDVPFFAILVLATLQFMPTEIYESARIDGASAVKSFFYITIPNIAKTIFTISIFFTMWRISSFDIVYGMTSGGPSNSTSLLAYQISVVAFRKMNLGYASAMAVVLFLIMAVLAIVNLHLSKCFDS